MIFVKVLHVYNVTIKSLSIPFVLYPFLFYFIWKLLIYEPSTEEPAAVALDRKSVGKVKCV